MRKENDQVERPSLDEMFPRAVIERGVNQPDKIYLTEVSGSAYTYGQVLEKGLRVANAMKASGVGPGDRVASMIPTSADSVIIMAATAFLGGIHVPINTAYMGHMLEHAVQLTGPSLIILEDDYEPRLDGIAMAADVQVVVRGRRSPRSGTRQDFPEQSFERMCNWAPLNLDEVHSGSWEDTAALLFTSGTTGASKAVTIPWYHFYLSTTRMWQIDSLGPDVRFYCPWPINHVTGSGAVYLVALLGGTLILRRKWSTSNFVDEVVRYECTITDLMAEMVHYFENMSGLEHTSLTHIFIAPVTETAVAILDSLGVAYCTNYNSTETNSPIGSLGYEPVPVGSAGRLRPGVEVRIVDDDGQDVVEGDPGELLVRTDDPAGMSTSYWGMPGATAHAWRDGWFHTGDILRRDIEGFFYMAGRVKDRIRVGGENVNPDEVEMIVNRHPGVSQCAAVSHALPQGGDEIWLFIVPSGGEFDEADVRKFCDRELPKFMRPSRFIRTDELPTTPTGKIQRSQVVTTSVDW